MRIDDTYVLTASDLSGNPRASTAKLNGSRFLANQTKLDSTVNGAYTVC